MADNVTTDELEVALQELATSMGLSVKEYVEGGFLDLTTYGTDQAAILSRLDAIDVVDSADSIESIAEKIIAINAVLSDDDGALQGILDLINVNKADLITERTRALGIEAGLRTDVDAANAKGVSVESAFNTYKTANDSRVAAAETATAGVADRVTDTEAQLSTLEAANDVVGSVAYAVAQEAARAKSVSGSTADLNTTETGSLVGAINEVQDAVNVAQAGVNSNVVRITATEGAIDILNGDDTVNGSVAKAVKDATGGDISDLSGRMTTAEAGISDNTGALNVLNGDSTVAGSVDKKILDASSQSNVITDALAGRLDAHDVKLDVIQGDDTVDGSIAKTVKDAKDIIDASIATETARAEAAEGVTSTKVQTLEDILNDTTDGDDNLVKGVVSKVADNAAAISTQAQKQIDDLEQAVIDLKAYSDARDLKASSMDICSVGNVFRTALGLGDSTCDDSGDGAL